MSAALMNLDCEMARESADLLAESKVLMRSGCRHHIDASGFVVHMDDNHGDRHWTVEGALAGYFDVDSTSWMMIQLADAVDMTPKVFAVAPWAYVDVAFEILISRYESTASEASEAAA